MLKIQDIHEAVLDGKRRSALEDRASNGPAHFQSLGLEAEYAQYKSGINLLELIRALDQRKSERHAVILSVACCAKLLSNDPNARIRNIAGIEYIRTYLIPALERHQIQHPAIATYLHQLHDAL